MTNDLAIKILTGDVLGTTEQTHEAVEMAIKALLALPSTERHGKWIIVNDDDPDLSSSKCSSCGTHFSIDTVLDNYCPHCGAKMDMANLVDRQKAYDVLNRSIKNLSSVDTVNVIRCEKCKHYNNIDFHCYYHGSICFKPNDYCPYGEVRNNG